MDNATTGVAKHSMHYTIFLAEQRLMVLALLDIVYLHTIVTLRGQKQATFVIEIQ